MAVGIVQLNAELQLVPDFDAFSVRVLQATGQCVRHIQVSRELVSLGCLVDDLHAVLIQLVVVGQDRSRDLICAAGGLRVFRVEGQIMALDQLRRDQPNTQTLEQRDQPEVDSHVGSKDDGFCWSADGVFDFIRPNIVH